ncbi:NitT/TauT family transport system substrate-binding protein [Rhodoferax sp. OV413]|nr:NitT/TauT family transport system substrate-binding protein [Rhodoferax sp. OV413]
MLRGYGKRCAGKASNFFLFSLIGLLVALSLGVYMWTNFNAIGSVSHQKQKVVIATNNEYAGSCAVMVAQEKGFFVNEGLVVSIKPVTSGKAAMAAILEKKADIGTVADIPVMFAGLSNAPISVIATIFAGERDHGIVGRRDKGIDTAASLKGKSIGVPLGTSAHFTLDAFLNRQKLLPDEVTKRTYKPEELANALAAGSVDAVAIWEPFLSAAMSKLGDNGVLFYGQDVYESIYNMVGMQNYISEHPETIKKIIRGLISGAKVCVENPAIAQEVVSKITKIEKETLKASWSSYRFDIVLDQGLILALEDEARWAIKNKLTDKVKVPNYLGYVYIDGLESISSSAVTIIH